MKPQLTQLSVQYLAGLRKHLAAGAPANLRTALRLGRQSVGLGLETLELARIHEHSLATLRGSGRDSETRTRQADHFFNEAITPIVETHRAARRSKEELQKLNIRLDRRTLELAATNRQLKQGIVRRKSVEATLKKSGAHYAKLLKDSLKLQEELRRLTHRVLVAQENERQKLSRELQDEVAQTLLGIIVRLVSLKQEARVNTEGLKKEIASTQQMVVDSSQTLRRVGRNF